jgi:hypothetical protein
MAARCARPGLVDPFVRRAGTMGAESRAIETPIARFQRVTGAGRR